VIGIPRNLAYISSVHEVNSLRFDGLSFYFDRRILLCGRVFSEPIDKYAYVFLLRVELLFTPRPAAFEGVALNVEGL